VRLNLGCGPHWQAAPDGWVHADVADFGQQLVVDLATPPYGIPYGTADVMVMHHVLHMLTPDQGRACLSELHMLASPGGTLRIGERSLWAGLDAHNRGGQWLHDVVSDDVEPTLDGKLLRWLTWHGTVRTLWSPTSLLDALQRAGWRSGYAAEHGRSRAPLGADLDTRPWETFYVEAVA
jgi:hypothetical protein